MSGEMNYDDGLKEAIVNDICKNTSMNEKEKLEYYSKKYESLYSKYPQIIKKACEPEFDVDRFLWMLSMIDNVNTNKITKHNADIEVGELLVDKHIKTKLS